MVREFLENISLFSNLTETDLGQICSMVEEVRLPAGEELFSEGSPGDRAYVIQEGQLEVLKISSGREVLLSVQGPDSVIGEMALLEKAPRMASVRALTDSVLLAITKEQFDQLLNTSPTAARTMLDTVLARWRNTTARLQQSERMAQLGTLSAGVAHELNNPAAAVTRGAEQLQDAIEQYEWSRGQLDQCSFSGTQWETLQELSRHAQTQATHPPLLDALTRSGAKDGDIEIVKVPGAFEIPLVAKMVAAKKAHNAVICLGAVIRGSTPHFDYVSAEVSKGVAQASLESGTPIIFGVITTDTIEQAIERAGTKAGNKGWSAAVAAVEMANLMEVVDQM